MTVDDFLEEKPATPSQSIDEWLDQGLSQPAKAQPSPRVQPPARFDAPGGSIQRTPTEGERSDQSLRDAMASLGGGQFGQAFRQGGEALGHSFEEFKTGANELVPGFLEQATTSPLPATHFEPSSTDTALGRLGKATINKATGLVESGTSPAMLATLGAGAVPALTRPIAAGFAAQMGSSIPGAWDRMQQAISTTPKFSQARYEAALDLLALGVFTKASMQLALKARTPTEVAPPALPAQPVEGTPTMARFQPEPVRSETPESAPITPDTAQPVTSALAQVLGQNEPTVEPQGQPEQPAAEPVAKPLEPPQIRGQRATPSDGGFSEDPLVRFVIDDMGGLLSKSSARKTGQALNQYDDAPLFSDPRHNKVYDPKSGQLPDTVAQAASDAGLLPAGADATTLWQRLEQISRSAKSMLGQERAQKANIATANKQDRSFVAAIGKQEPGEKPINASDLQVGDTVTVNGEPMKVSDIDPESYDVRLDDGSRFGVQHISDNQVIYGEHELGPVARVAEDYSRLSPEQRFASDHPPTPATTPSNNPEFVQKAREHIAGPTPEESEIQSRRHWVALDPESQEPHEVFGDLRSAQDYMATVATAGEKLVAREPGKPDKVIKAIPLSPQVEHARLVRAMREHFGKSDLTGADQDFYLKNYGRKPAIRRETGTGTARAQAQAQTPKVPHPYGPELNRLSHDLFRRDYYDLTPVQKEQLAYQARVEGIVRETPKLRPGEKEGDLFQGKEAPFNLAGEKGIDWEARQKEAEKAEAERIAVENKTDKEQGQFHLRSGESAALNLAPLQSLAKPIQHGLEMRPLNDKIAYGYDTVQTRANELARQAANSVALDFGSSKKPSAAAMADREAMPFVVEAGGDRAELTRDLNRVANSRDKALAKKFTPIIQHALDNFARLNQLKSNYVRQQLRQLTRERKAGLDVKEVPDYVTRLLDLPENKKQLLPVGGGKGQGNRYFMRGRAFEKLSDAIHEGYAPKATDIVTLTQHRVEAGERLVQQKRFEQELRKLQAPDGRPIVGDLEQRQTLYNGPETRVPKGYSVVQTGGRPLVVHQEFSKLFNALYGQTGFPRALAKYSGFAKRYTLVFDTYHVGRITYKELAYSKGAQRVGYNRGLSILEYSDRDLGRAVAAGDITPREAAYSKANRATADLLIRHGINVGKVADNLWAEQVKALPVIGGFNDWVFQKLSRGAMLQSAIENFGRNMRRFPEREVEGNARQTAKEMNEVFGNMQNQGLLKNKTYQDAARSVLLAPNWSGSQLRAESRGYAQLAKAPIDLLRGKPRLGVVAQGQIAAVLGMLAANQVLNYISTGHSTFENEKAHWLDAFIPGGKRGFWFNPFEIAGEYAFAAHRYLNQHMHPIDVATRIASNKLSPVGRSIKTLFSGRDYAGRPFLSATDRIRAALTDVLPSPIPLSGVLEHDPRQTTGFRLNRQLGSLEAQALRSSGMKVAAQPSPRSQMYALAHDFRPEKGYTDMAGEYTDLRRALDNDQLDNARSEVALLLKQGKTRQQISGALAGTERYTGSVAREADFLRSLNPAQKALYRQAQLDHAANQRKLLSVLGSH